MAVLEHVIVKPVLTEKTSVDTERHNRYAFIVRTGSNKNQIKAAVEKIYDVKVVKVRTSIRPGKIKRAGKKVAKSSSSKHAFVEIEQGQKIELFKSI